VVLADKGYAGASDHMRVPYKGRDKPAELLAKAIHVLQVCEVGAWKVHSMLRKPVPLAPRLMVAAWLGCPCLWHADRHKGRIT